MTTPLRDPRDLDRILPLLRALRVRRPRRALLEEAEVELWRLWRREQAALLRAAAALAGAELDPEALARWRAGARECVRLCAADGYPVAPLLARCSALPCDLWPTQRQLELAAERRAG